MDDQKVRPDGPADDEQDPEFESEPITADRAESMNLRVVHLSGVLAVLVVFGAVMTWLYLDRDRAVAAKTAEFNGERTRLEEPQHHADDLNAQLKTAQANALDPQGYQLIKSCVQQAYSNQQAEREIVIHYPDLSNIPPSVIAMAILSAQIDPKTGRLSLPASSCDDALKYLK